MFPEIIMQAGEIVEWILNEGGGQYRCKVNAETQALVEELMSVASYSPFLEWSAMGAVDSEEGYFTIRAKYTTEKSPCQVIEVDFRARKVLSRAA